MDNSSTQENKTATAFFPTLTHSQQQTNVHSDREKKTISSSGQENFHCPSETIDNYREKPISKSIMREAFRLGKKEEIINIE